MTAIARRLMALELLWLALLAPFLFFPDRGRGIALVGVPLLWALRWLAWRRVVPRTPLDLPLLVLLAMVGVSLLISPDPPFSLPKATGLVLGIALYYALAELAHRRQGAALALAVPLGVTTAMAGVGLFTTQWTSKVAALSGLIERLPRRLLELPNSPPDGFNPNGLAGALLLTAPLALTLTVLPRNPLLQALPRPLRPIGTIGLVVAALLLVGVLILTQSRGGYLGLAAGLATLVGLLLLRRARRRVGVALGVAALAGLGTLLWQGRALLAAAVGGELIQGRLALWERARYGIADFPLTGMGMGMFRRIVPLLYPLSGVGVPTDVGHAHNQFLSAGVDLGVPGLVALMAIWLGSALMVARALRAPGASRTERALIVGIAAGLMAHFVWALTDSNVLGSKAGFPLWTLLGALALCHARLVPPPSEGAP